VSRLILLNGPPASGKSTLARQFVDAHPLALDLDIDIVRGQLGAWTDRPSEAGLLARRLAIAMARTALEAGHDVIVPQLGARVEFVEQLERLARDTGAAFVEVVLTASKPDVHEWFAARSADPATAADRDAQLLVDQLGGTDALDRMHDGLAHVVASRPRTRSIPARRGSADDVLHAFELVLADERPAPG